MKGWTKDWFRARTSRWEEGQALVETAVALTLLVVLVVGAVEFGMIAYAAIEVSNAARAAAQYGAMNGGAFLSSDSTGMDSVGMLNAAQGDAGNFGTGVSFSTGYPTYSCFCSSSSDTTASCTPPATPSGCTSSKLIVTVSVKTQTTFTPPIRIPGLGSSITLTGLSQQEVLQ